MKELIDKTEVVTEIDKIINDANYVPFTDEVLGKLTACKKIKNFINTLEVKDVNDVYKQGYNDAIDKFCEFMQNCEGYVVSGNKCNYDNFIKYMEEQQ